REGDVRAIASRDLPPGGLLAWASFPCQDLSLAGPGFGLKGQRSGVFWPFWNLILQLKRERRNPPLIVLENVTGLITSHGGQDLRNLVAGLVAAGYHTGALVIDAARFLPQSRPRLFIVAVDNSIRLPRGLAAQEWCDAWHSHALRRTVASMPASTRRGWVW